MKRAHTIFFCADTHFNHNKVHQMQTRRPGSNPKDHDNCIIKNWNKNVKPGDTVIILGDVFFCGANMSRSILNRLNGTKIRVRGNHDAWSHTQAMANGFAFSCDELVMDIAGEKVILSHYPYRFTFWEEVKARLRNPFRKKPKYANRRPKNEGGWMMHGHTHSYDVLRDKMIHVGMDAWNYRPVHISHIEHIIQTGKLPRQFRKKSTKR